MCYKPLSFITRVQFINDLVLMTLEILYQINPLACSLYSKPVLQIALILSMAGSYIDLLQVFVFVSIRGATVAEW